jgi:hypothetical protein
MSLGPGRVVVQSDGRITTDCVADLSMCRNCLLFPCSDEITEGDLVLHCSTGQFKKKPYYFQSVLEIVKGVG